MLHVAISNIPMDVQVDPSAFSLAPGTTRQIDVRVTGPRALNDHLLYDSNDPDEPSVKQYLYKNNTSFPQLGSEALDFSCKDLDGFWHYLSDCRGSVVYLEFGGLW